MQGNNSSTKNQIAGSKCWTKRRSNSPNVHSDVKPRTSGFFSSGHQTARLFFSILGCLRFTISDQGNMLNNQSLNVYFSVANARIINSTACLGNFNDANRAGCKISWRTEFHLYFYVFRGVNKVTALCNEWSIHWRWIEVTRPWLYRFSVLCFFFFMIYLSQEEEETILADPYGNI